MNNRILKELEIYLSKSDNQKSSHWKYRLEGSDYYNIYKSLGFGDFTKIKNIYVESLNFLLLF